MKVNQIINEASINSISFEKLWRDKDFQGDLENHGVFQGDIQYFRMENPEHEETHWEEIQELPEFQAFVKNRMEEMYDDLFYDIEIKKGYITLYREMTVRKDWIAHLEKNPKSRLGMFWSFDEDAAEAHWGKFDNRHHKATIVINIKETFVDWEETFKSNMKIPEEKEITLFKNTPLKIIRILDNRGEPMDISSIENNTYKA